MFFLKPSFMLFFLFLLSGGCKSQPLTLSKETAFGTFKYSRHDQHVIDDLIHSCGTEIIMISDELKLALQKNIIIEIYPDQRSYNDHIINPDLKGSPAISGGNMIQLVSPLSKIKIDTISYTTRLKFLTHEYVHVLLSQLTPEIPVWLNEGLACYYGSYAFYHAVAVNHFAELNFFPTLDHLQNQYDEIPAADLFSFLVADYLINACKNEDIDQLIRHPDKLLSLDKEWIRYITEKYGRKVNN